MGDDERNFETNNGGLVLLERLYLVWALAFQPVVNLAAAGVRIGGMSWVLVLGAFSLYYHVLSNRVDRFGSRARKFVLVATTIAFALVWLPGLFGLVGLLTGRVVPTAASVAGSSSTVATAALLVLEPELSWASRLNAWYVTRVRESLEGRDIAHRVTCGAFVAILAASLLLSYAFPPRVVFPARERSDFRVGFWTYGVPLDDRPLEAGDETFPILSNETLDRMAAAGAYFVFGLDNASLMLDEPPVGHLSFLDRLRRCKDHGVEVRLSVFPRPMPRGLTFFNVFTQSVTFAAIDQVLEILDEEGLLGFPITGLTFDVEPVVEYAFSGYGLAKGDLATFAESWNVLRGYEEDLARFREKARNYSVEYGLDAEVCTLVSSPLDFADGDDDLHRLWGMQSLDGEPWALRSFMAYRGDLFTQDFVRDSASTMGDGDAVILAGFYRPGEVYRESLDLLVNDALLVKNWPGADLQLQVWPLARFVEAYGEGAVAEFLDRLAAGGDAEFDARGWGSLAGDCWWYAMAFLDHWASWFARF
ncbi:MAG: hypothetical protein Kow0069_30480 [Promethearchaeota archaeon]